MTGNPVSSLVPPGTTIPPPASEGKTILIKLLKYLIFLISWLLVPSFATDDILSESEYRVTFGPNPFPNPPVATDYIFNIASVVVENSIFEGDEGFVLFVRLDESNNPDDVISLVNEGTLVTIRDGKAFITCVAYVKYI